MNNSSKIVSSDHHLPFLFFFQLKLGAICARNASSRWAFGESLALLCKLAGFCSCRLATRNSLCEIPSSDRFPAGKKRLYDRVPRDWSKVRGVRGGRLSPPFVAPAIIIGYLFAFRAKFLQIRNITVGMKSARGSRQRAGKDPKDV